MDVIRLTTYIYGSDNLCKRECAGRKLCLYFTCFLMLVKWQLCVCCTSCALFYSRSRLQSAPTRCLPATVCVARAWCLRQRITEHISMTRHLQLRQRHADGLPVPTRRHTYNLLEVVVLGMFLGPARPYHLLPRRVNWTRTSHLVTNAFSKSNLCGLVSHKLPTSIAGFTFNAYHAPRSWVACHPPGEARRSR